MFKSKNKLMTFIILCFIFYLCSNLTIREYFNANSKLNYPIYWINLDRSKERKEYMTKNFKKYKVNNYRFSAINGYNLKKYPHIKFTKKQKEVYESGELGCVSSHINLIIELYKHGVNEAIIMEDDISINTLPKMKYKIKDIANNAPKDWEVLQLHTSNHKLIKEYLSNSILYVRSGDKLYGTCSYLINRKGMKKLYDICYKKGNIVFPDEDIIADHFIYNTCITYYFTKPLFIHLAGKSTTHMDTKFEKGHAVSKAYLLDYFKMKDTDL